MDPPTSGRQYPPPPLPWWEQSWLPRSRRSIEPGVLPAHVQATRPSGRANPRPDPPPAAVGTAAPVAEGGLASPAEADGPPVTFPAARLCAVNESTYLSSEHVEILLPNAHAHRDESLDPDGAPPPPGRAGAGRPAFCARVTFLLEGDAQAAPQTFPLVLRVYWSYSSKKGRHNYRRALSVGVSAFRAGARLQPGDTLVCRRAGGEAGLVVRVTVRRGENRRAPGPRPRRPPPPPPRLVPPPPRPGRADADGPPVTFPAAPMCASTGPKIFLSSEHVEILLPNAHAHRDESLDPGGVPPPPGRAGAGCPAFCAPVTFLLEGDAQAAPQSFPLVLRAYWQCRANTGRHRYDRRLSTGVAAFRAGARLHPGDTLVCRRAGGEAGLVVRVSVRRGENRRAPGRPPGRPPPPPPRLVPPPPPPDADGPPVTFPAAGLCALPQIFLSSRNLEILLANAHAHRDEALDPGGAPPPPGRRPGAGRPAFCARVTFLLEGDVHAAPQSFPLVFRAYWEYRANAGRHRYRRMLSVGVSAFRAGARLQPGDVLVCRRAGGAAGLVVRVSVRRGENRP